MPVVAQRGPAGAGPYVVLAELGHGVELAGLSRDLQRPGSARAQDPVMGPAAPPSRVQVSAKVDIRWWAYSKHRERHSSP
jgi:hypothetical protein